MFTNILENASKYTEPAKPPVVSPYVANYKCKTLFGKMMESVEFPKPEVDPNLPDKDGIIPNIEKAFSDDPIGKKVCYMVANSHEYKDRPNTEAGISFTKNYVWKEDTMRLDKMQGINKPVMKEKVLDMANSIKETGEKNALVVLDKIHGVYPQSPGSKILFDGHHRKEALEFLGEKYAPVYYGKYTGNAEKNVEELIGYDNDNLSESAILIEGAISSAIKKIGSIFKPKKKTVVKNSTSHYLNMEKYLSLTSEVLKELLPMMDKYVTEVNKQVDDNLLQYCNDYGKKTSDIINTYNKKFSPNDNFLDSSEVLRPKCSENGVYYNDATKFVAAWNIIADKCNKVIINHNVREKFADINTMDNNEKLIYGTMYSSLNIFGEFIYGFTSAVKFVNNDFTYEFKTVLENASITESVSDEYVSLTPEEAASVSDKYGNVDCSFHKCIKNGKYFCKTQRARSEYYDSPTDIPKKDVAFVSSTS